MADKVRFGIIGSAGLIGNHHANILTQGEGPYTLTALCDFNAAKLQEQSDKLKLPGFTKVEELLARQDIDAVIVCTPHTLHAQHVTAVVESGRDVITEKPLASTPALARAMIKAINRTRRIGGVHYQSRGKADVIQTKQMIQSGALGKLLAIRVTGSYYKSDYYYTLGGWRGTWKDEGGGVLINQAPHDIDLMCYLAAGDRPAEMSARWTNLYHTNSQVEDIAAAVGRFPNGVEFVLNVSVAMHGDPSRIEIFGTAGAVTLAGGDFARYVRYEQDLTQFARAYGGDNPYAGPPVQEQPLPEKTPFDAALVHKRFAEAVLTRDRKKLLVPAAEALWSAETIYGVLYAGYVRKAIKLPVNAGRYDAMLADLIAKSPTVERGAKEAASGMSAISFIK